MDPCPPHGQPPNGRAPRPDAVYDTLILPEIEKAVNTTAVFEDLRRVYLSRVAAEWIRLRSENRPTAFSDIIGSGDVSRWPARTAWNPRDVFDEMVQSFNNGEYREPHTFSNGTTSFVLVVSFGGVDFSNSPRDNLTPEAFEQAAPAMPETIATAQLTDLTDVDAVHSWLGGQAAPPPPPGQPAQGGGGGLAVTGTSLTATISAGIMLIAIGVALVVWQRHMRRRRRTPTL
jgi:hypothetical protein